MSEQLSYAVVDQGSTATKAALCDLSGRVYRRSEEATPTQVREGRIEVDAEAIAESVDRLLTPLLHEEPVGGIGMTCQRSTCLIWDRQSGHAMTPALSWQDTSQIERVDRLAAHAKDVARISGLRLSPHYAAVKLAALLEEIPDGARRAAAGELAAGTLDAFLMARLTGEPATEPGHAGRTLLYNLDRGIWDPHLCDLFGVPVQALPLLRPSAGDWGSYQGIPVCAGAGDQQAALLGHGGWREGVVAVHFGTGAFVLAATGVRVRRHERLLSAAVASTSTGRRFQLEGSINSAGSAVDWARKLTGEDLDRWTTRELTPEELPWVVPAFAGLGAPWWQPRTRASIHNLTTATGRSDLVGGVLVGIAMRVVDNLEAIADAGELPSIVRVSGKLMRLRGLVGLIANLSGLPVEVARNEEVGLVGICRLAATGLSGEEQRLDRSPPSGWRCDPKWSDERRIELRGRWRDLMRQITNARS